MEIQTRLWVHQIVEYVRMDSDFPFDIHDDIDEILRYYRIPVGFDPDEMRLLEMEILKLVEQAQNHEMARVAFLVN